jgi:propanol-preferring alcohol dehydrogenase
VVISGIGGLGHMAVQYARAMGFHVIAVDVSEEKLALARSLGVAETINAMTDDPVERVQQNIRGAHGVLVTAVSRSAFSQAIGMLHKRGTMSLVGLPPGNFDLPIFDVVLNAKTVRGSIVGTRKDLQEALEFAGEGKVAAHYSMDKLDTINAIFAQMKAGKIDGRVVVSI